MAKEGERYYDIITPKKNLFDINFKEIWQYRDLLFLFVRRDFVAVYKQTVLGPLWFFIQPIFTTIIYTVVFSTMGNISTDGLPPILFYLCGVTSWNYFSECLTKTSNTFVANAGIFGKVYFPRLVLPMSIVISNLIKFGVQFLLFTVVLLYYYSTSDVIQPNKFAFTLPALILLMAGLGFGFGIIISSLTTRYRDFQFLIVFGIQLFMYATPIVYPLSLVNERLGNYAWVVELNPMTSIVEAMRYGFLGTGQFDWGGLLYSFGFMCVLLISGVVVFNKVEQNFIDTV